MQKLYKIYTYNSPVIHIMMLVYWQFEAEAELEVRNEGWINTDGYCLGR